MLVLAPTRELALQSAEVIAEAGGHCGIKSVCVYGGVPKRDQKIALGGGRGGGCVQVVVATPGRLKDLVGEGACDLSKVRYGGLGFSSVFGGQLGGRKRTPPRPPAQRKKGRSFSKVKANRAGEGEREGGMGEEG